LRLGFAGTPAFAAALLAALLDSPHEVVAVYTQPDRRAGRGRKLRPSAVAELAEKHRLPLRKPVSLRGEAEARELASFALDVLVVAAYGLLLPRSILALPQQGCINVHASMLPRWRGAAPIERALLAGDRTSGITIMLMDEGLDSGDIVLQREVPIGVRDDRVALEAKLVAAGCEALRHSLDHLPELLAKRRQQNHGLATYAHKLDKSEALIDWNAPAESIDRQVRAGVGRMPAFALLGSHRLRILRTRPAPWEGANGPPGTILHVGPVGLVVACGSGALQVELVQLAGKNPVAVAALRNSPATPFQAGERFHGPATA